MDKKPLIAVSIFAVILLVLGSLSNVVGYQSVKSTTVNDSPLFQTRTQKAINKESKILISDYLGKGEETHLYLPIRDSQKEIIDRLIILFKAMNDKSFDEFVNKFISYVHQNDANNLKADGKEIKNILYQIKGKPDALKNYYMMINEKNKSEHSFEYFCQITIMITILLTTIFLPILILYSIYLKITNFLCNFFDLETVSVG
jgi:hypothetical protein